MSNSSLVSYTKISPNRSSPRKNPIDRISIHCFVGQVTAKSGCNAGNFTRYDPENGASCNYVVGHDGSIGLCVEEKDRSWCTSSRANDHRAITIETASETKHPYRVTASAYAALLDLVTDICRRNGKTKILWFGDKAKTLAYQPKANEMVMTVHRWFANKSCPGDYLYGLHDEIAAEVNKRLAGGGSTPSTPGTGGQVAVSYTVRVKASDLNIRTGPGTSYASKGFIKPGVYTVVAEASGAGASAWGKLKSGAGWISLDYVEKTGGGAAATDTIKVGSTVTIKSGAVYGGLAASRGANVPSYISGANRRYTVGKIAEHKGVQEALLKEVTSWVALSYLNLV